MTGKKPRKKVERCINKSKIARPAANLAPTGKWYDLKKAAKFLRVWPNTLYNWCSDKLIVFYNDYAKNLREDILSDDVHQQSGAIVRELSLAYAIIKKDGTIESRKLMEEGLSRLNYYNTGDCNIISDKKLLIPSASVEKKTDIIKVATITIE